MNKEQTREVEGGRWKVGRAMLTIGGITLWRVRESQLLPNTLLLLPVLLLVCLYPLNNPTNRSWKHAVGQEWDEHGRLWSGHCGYGVPLGSCASLDLAMLACFLEER